MLAVSFFLFLVSLFVFLFGREGTKGISEELDFENVQSQFIIFNSKGTKMWQYTATWPFNLLALSYVPLWFYFIFVHYSLSLSVLTVSWKMLDNKISCHIGEQVEVFSDPLSSGQTFANWLHYLFVIEGEIWGSYHFHQKNPTVVVRGTSPFCQWL